MRNLRFRCQNRFEIGDSSLPSVAQMTPFSQLHNSCLPERYSQFAIFLMQRLNTYNPLSNPIVFGPAVLVLLPALLFSALMPDWAPQAALAGLALVFALRGIATERGDGSASLNLPLLVLLALLPVTLLVTTDAEISLPRVYAFIANLACFGAVAGQRNTPWLRKSGWLLLLGGLALGIIVLMGTDLGKAKLPFISPEIYNKVPGGNWHAFWDGDTFNPNMAGGLLALFWPPAVVLIRKGVSWQQRDFAKLVAAALLILLILTQSRGALFGMALALPVITLLQSRRWALVWIVALLGLLFVTYRFGPTGILESIAGRSDIFGDPSLQGRQELWGYAADLIARHPLTGVGLGMVEPAIKSIAPAIRAETQFGHAHNLFLNAGAELGLAGMTAYVWFYATLLILLVKRVLLQRNGQYRSLALGLLGSLIVFLAHGLVDTITFSPYAAVVVWGLFGLMVAVATSAGGSPDEKQAQRI